MGLRLFHLGGIVALVASVLAMPAHAVDYKIGIVDLQRAASTSPQAEAARKKIDREFRKRDRQLIAKQKEIRQMEEELVKNRDLMSEDQLGRLNRNLRRERREFQRALSEFNEDRNVRNNEELRNLQNEVIRVTQQLAKQDKFDLVLIRGVVVFVDEGKLDITNKVVELLKRNHKSN
jgi:outer membrane protein